MTAEQPFRDADLLTLIRDVPDFPRPGILFKDITPALLDPRAFRHIIRRMGEQVRELDANCIVAIEARGFLFGAALAHELGLGLVPVRKPGKLPWRSVSEPYSLEYGSDALEIHQDALAPGARAVVIDDVLATGGTAGAVARLIDRVGGRLCGFAFLIELGALGGRKALEGREIRSVLSL